MQRFALHTLFGGLVRRTWVVALIAVVVCSAFAARAVAALVEADYLAPAQTSGVRPLTPQAKLAPPRKHPDGSSLVERNMFCSTCQSVDGPNPAGSVLQPAVLIETSIAAEPRATVRVIATEVQGSWGLGETIPGLGVIDRIGPTSIDVIDSHEHRGRLSLLEAAGPGSGTAMPGAGSAADPWAAQIKKLDDKNYEVDRELVRDLVRGVAKPGGMRAIPIVENGDIKGVRMLGVSQGTIGYSLGLKSGDLLSAIDGEPIKSAQQLLDLYAKIDQLSAVELSGTRAGKPLVLTLRLR